MKIIRAVFKRTFFVLLAAVTEVALFFVLLHFLDTRAAWIEGVMRILAIFIAVYAASNSRHLSFDVMWIIIILLFPVAGTALYLFLGSSLINSRTTKAIVNSTKDSEKYYIQNEDVYKRACSEFPYKSGIFHYISRKAGFPVYPDRHYDYYPFGENGYPVMIEELRNAKEFIFLEYFIIEEGDMWSGIHEILKQKADEGLDVRVMYDDAGSMETLSIHYAKQLESEGIKAMPFNRINPVLSTIMNHRDHRKIMVIDGVTAFSGGVNLADEYINRKKRFGVWKDNMIRVKGEAVWSFTVMFLTHWNALRKEDDDFTVFKRKNDIEISQGFIAPYGETPLDDQIVAQDIYISIINSAEKYCWIMTPYLIIDNEMVNALVLAAGRGVDVRIITPGIPDKKAVFQITRSFYKTLIDGGVKIGEYTPGFVHAKVFVSDDVCATVGTVNLDYRSLYLHFENGTFICGSSAVENIRKDYAETWDACKVIEPEKSRGNMVKAFFVTFLKLFASQM
jgi:cardiolipin synthase